MARRPCRFCGGPNPCERDCEYDASVIAAERANEERLERPRGEIETEFGDIPVEGVLS